MSSNICIGSNAEFDRIQDLKCMSTLWLFFFGAKIISQTRRWLLTGRAYAAFINQPSLLDLKEKNRQSNGKILKEKETKNGKRKEEKDGWREAR